MYDEITVHDTPICDDMVNFFNPNFSSYCHNIRECKSCGGESNNFVQQTQSRVLQSLFNEKWWRAQTRLLEILNSILSMSWNIISLLMLAVAMTRSKCWLRQFEVSWRVKPGHEVLRHGQKHSLNQFSEHPWKRCEVIIMVRMIGKIFLASCWEVKLGKGRGEFQWQGI